ISDPWRAFGAGLVVPGAGLVYAIPIHHELFSPAMVIGHTVLIALEILGAAWALRRVVWLAIAAAAAGSAGLGVAAVQAPHAVVIAGHVAGFAGGLAACAWGL